MPKNRMPPFEKLADYHAPSQKLKQRADAGKSDPESAASGGDEVLSSRRPTLMDCFIVATVLAISSQLRGRVSKMTDANIDAEEFIYNTGMNECRHPH